MMSMFFSSRRRGDRRTGNSAWPGKPGLNVIIFFNRNEWMNLLLVVTMHNALIVKFKFPAGWNTFYWYDSISSTYPFKGSPGFITYFNVEIWFLVQTTRRKIEKIWHLYSYSISYTAQLCCWKCLITPHSSIFDQYRDILRVYRAGESTHCAMMLIIWGSFKKKASRPIVMLIIRIV